MKSLRLLSIIPKFAIDGIMIYYSSKNIVKLKETHDLDVK